MKSKKIVGFMGDAVYCKKASEILKGFGYHRVSINNKVREIAKYLMKIEDGEINNETLEKIRNRGYLVNRLYWINLVLASVPEGMDKVVVEDLRIEDIVKDVIIPYYFVTWDKKEESRQITPPDIELIITDKLDKDKFYYTLEYKFKKENNLLVKQQKAPLL